MKTKMLETNSDKVLFSTGYYCKYVVSVSAATEVMRIMVQAGAVRVDSSHQGIYYPVTMDMKLEMLDLPFMDDVPVNDKKRQEYLAWLETKGELLGESYVPEPYSVYLADKENENENP